MSDSAQSPGSSSLVLSPPLNHARPPPANGSPPSRNAPPPPDSFSDSLTSNPSPAEGNTTGSPPSPKAHESSPPPNSPPPSSSPPSSPPPRPSPPPISQPPPEASPPPLSPPKDTPHSPPPQPPPSSSSTSPPPTTNESPSVPSQSSSPSPPSNLATTPPALPLEFLPPPSDVGGLQSPTPPKEFVAPSPPTADTGSLPSNSSTSLSTTAPAPKQFAASRGSSPVASASSTNQATSTTSTAGNGGSASDNSSVKIIFGAVLVSVVLVAVVGIIFFAKKRKKRNDHHAPHYMPPKNFTVQTDRYIYGQHQHGAGFSGLMNFSYGSPHSQDRYSENGESGVIGSGKTHFSYEEVMEMTDGFSRRNIVGEGGFGCVFKGQTSDGKNVAVKQLKAGSGQGEREFKAEVEIISRVHHRHLVSLVGYCIHDRQRLLLYEFLPNKTLEHHLHGTNVLDWAKRLRIAIGSAKGLAYLHEDCNPKIIHRDIKSANILLDDNFEAQVADFGLARLTDTTKTHVSTRVMGTFGYLAPEYASSGKLTDRSDVYSFGVVLLELITGRKPVDTTQPLGDESLVEWARPQLIRAMETGNLIDIVDPRLGKHYVESEMLRMIETAAACVRHSAPKRPRMVQVVRALDSDNMSDINNGVKVGLSTAYDSGVYNEEIRRFRRMAFAMGESSEFDTMSGEYTTTEVSEGSPLSNFTSQGLEIRAIKR